MKRIFLDNNATTALDPRVLEVVTAELEAPPSNPASLHSFGKEAKKRLFQARSLIADTLGVSREEVIFTSGGTESMNLLIRGTLEGFSGHVISSKIEHACVFEALKGQKHLAVSWLPVRAKGCVEVQDLLAAIGTETKLIVLSAANSETGVKNPIEEIAKIAEERKIPFIVDGVALLGKELFTIPKGVSGIGFSGHKIHAPKGTGFIVVRPSLQLQPLFFGGGQEFGLRSGTENLPGIVGLAKAVSLLQEELPHASEHMRCLRDAFETALEKEIPGLKVHGARDLRISNTSNLSFPGMGGEDLLISLDLAGIAVSHGSACASGSLEPSRVLTEMGIGYEESRSAIRFSLSRMTTQEEITRTIHEIIQISRKFK